MRAREIGGGCRGRHTRVPWGSDRGWPGGWGQVTGAFAASRVQPWDFLAVQWLRLHDFTAGGVGSIRGQGTNIPARCTTKIKQTKNKPGPGEVGTGPNLSGRDPAPQAGSVSITSSPKATSKTPSKSATPAKDNSDSKNKPQNLEYQEKAATAKATQQVPVSINTHQRPKGPSPRASLPRSQNQHDKNSRLVTPGVAIV